MMMPSSTTVGTAGVVGSVTSSSASSLDTTIPTMALTNVSNNLQPLMSSQSEVQPPTSISQQPIIEVVQPPPSTSMVIQHQPQQPTNVTISSVVNQPPTTSMDVDVANLDDADDSFESISLNDCDLHVNSGSNPPPLVPGSVGTVGGQCVPATPLIQPPPPSVDVIKSDPEDDPVGLGSLDSAIQLDGSRSSSRMNGASSRIDNTARHEKSLGLLTTRFVSLLQESQNGVLDLKVVSVI